MPQPLDTRGVMPNGPAEHQLDVALRAAGGGSWMWWPTEDRVSLSDTCWTMLGFAPGEFGPSGTAWIERMHPEDAARFAAVTARCFDGSEDEYREVIRWRCKDQSWKHILSSGRAVQRDAEGRAVTFVGVLIDVEPIHRLRRKVEDQNEQLAAQVAELGDRNHELERFSHVASHDLRSPLRNMLMFASHLERSLPKGGQEAAYARRITRAGRRMHNLLDALLEYAESGRGKRPTGVADLARVVSDVVEDSQLAARGAAVCVGALPTVSGDPVLLRQLMQNLLLNAFKYAGGRPPRVSILAERQEASADRSARVRICVADAGEGFDPAEAERLFSPFQRMSHSAEGSGVGLAVVRRVAEQHGGRAWAAMVNADQATRFYVELPG
ncbi:sensor histidine kinase [Phycisphaera mikurensis]|uniref:histidine kinase n=1 Tax=Phycisphaera mikurensis (strain NBRC 102666 / KCTC 22515 / FYK2301M01) TaxID=1142394 RepID=I0IEX8_PHYMF|nr:PAS domain-containing sensor histidine kinase [Phycisphaera mikurensis]MBB6441610.1 signal transduction histidine kinase [Phycisphaera mikurensis]BAM03816.1 putative two-component system sensor histidine kinase [Phycisphaera mikurensis NBRC 102666]